MLVQSERAPSADEEGRVADDEWMTITGATAYLKVSRPTLYRWMTDGLLPFYTLPSDSGRRFKRSDLDALLTPGSPSAERETRTQASESSPE